MVHSFVRLKSRIQKAVFAFVAAEIKRLVFPEDHVIGQSTLDFRSAHWVYDFLAWIFGLEPLLDDMDVGLMGHAFLKSRARANGIQPAVAWVFGELSTLPGT